MNWREKYEGKKEKEKDEDFGEPKDFLRTWVWKREPKMERMKFERPYTYTIISQKYPKQELTLKIKQQPFHTEGFASTVWDSSIVISKYFEKWHSEKVHMKKCLDLSAGCGLVACVLYHLAASEITATDLSENLPLLSKNLKANTHLKLVKAGLCEKVSIQIPKVEAFRWGDQVNLLNPPYDLIVSCDIMYVRDQIYNLHKSLRELTKEGSEIYLCHGKYCWVQDEFLDFVEKKGYFEIDFVAYRDFDEIYRAEDIECIKLIRRAVPIKSTEHR